MDEDLKRGVGRSLDRRDGTADGSLMLDDACLPFEEEPDGTVSALPTGAIANWKQGQVESLVCVRAVASILEREETHLERIQDAHSLQRGIEAFLRHHEGAKGQVLARIINGFYALTLLLALSGESLDAYTFSEEVVKLCLLHGDAESPDAEHMIARLAKLLESVERASEADTLRRRFRVEQLLLRGGQGSCSRLRYEAYRYIENGQYAVTVPIYQHLIKREYQLAGTYCHLARALILIGKHEAARAAVEKAWDHREDTACYERGRLLFLRLLFEILDTGIPGESLKELIEAMKNENIHNTWLVQPMVDHLKSDLAPRMHSLLSNIGNSLSSRS